MRKLKFEDDTSIANGSSAEHNLLLQMSFNELVAALGQPTYVGSGDEKVQLEWMFSDEDETYKVITVYDYKRRTSIYNIFEWNIGSKGLPEKEVIAFFEEKGIKDNLRKIEITGPNILKNKVE